MALSTARKLGYGVADVGASLSFVAVNTWFFYFLVNIVGLEPFIAGLVFIVGRVFDAVIDPVMGVFSDRVKTRFGRKRFMLYGAVPLGFVFALMWFAPEGSQLFKVLFALGAFMLFSFVYTVVQVPYMALTPELAPDYDERTSLTSYRMGFGTFASLLAVAVPPLIIAAFGGEALVTSSPDAWLMMGIIFGLIVAVAYLIAAFSIREPKSVGKPVKASFFSEYRSAFSIHGFSSIFVLFVVITTGLMILNSILPFFLESNLRLVSDQQSIVLGTLFGVAILTLPFWIFLSSRLGKRLSLAIGLAMLAVGVVLLVAFSPTAQLSVYLIVMTVFSGLGLSAVIMLPWAMLPDVVEFDEATTGRRREGLVYALFTFGQKLAGSLGVFANAIVASVFSYQQGSAEQASETLRALAVMAGPVAAAVFVIALLLSLRFPITKASFAEVKARLAYRDMAP